MKLFDLLRPKAMAEAANKQAVPPHVSSRPYEADGAQSGQEGALRERVIDALREVYDPEIPVNIYDLGLIYDLDIDDHGQVAIRMTLTAPGCPVAQTFPAQVAQAVESVQGVSGCCVDLTWEPPWTPERASEAARLQLGLFL